MADLPGGTVTFLFTDIEGSTALWERDRTATRAAVDRHLALLRDAIAAHGGVAFKTVGDAVQAAFATAPPALAAAVAGQRALQTEVWPAATGPLWVRMALHAGMAEPRDGDYLAPCLNRLSRLLASGHGQQVLLTETVRQLLEGELPAGASLRALGSHRLRDLLEPEGVFQVLAPGLPERFPPLRGIPTHPTNLVAPLTGLIGRDGEVALLLRLLTTDGARLVTLTGPGGTGKTRLAQEVAAEVLDRYPDGVFFVDLAPLTDPTLVVPTTAAALGVREVVGQPLAQTLAGFLLDKRLLLLLDNCERVLAAVPDVAGLLAAASQLAVLATSREPLHVRGEREVPVPPLPLPAPDRVPPIEDLARSPAVALFLERATASRPDFALTAGNAAAVVGICRRLDGLPLAIELVAARIKVLPPAALLARLEHRLPLLTGGGRDLPARQRTMRDALAWSYDLLAPAEQALFRCLTVFVGGFALEAAEAVCGGGDLDPFDGVASLVDKSLLREEDGPAGEPRYWMLETVREFGLEQLQLSGEEAAARRAHADWCLALAERNWASIMPSPIRVAWLDRITAEYDNLRAALAWLEQIGEVALSLQLAGHLSPFWIFRGPLVEGRGWLERLLKQGGEASGPVRARALFGLGRIAHLQGEYGRASEMLAESYALLQAAGDRHTGIFVLLRLGSTTMAQGDYAGATRLLEDALAMARDAGHEDWTAITLSELALVAYGRGDMVRATALADEALMLHQRLADPWGTAICLETLGLVALARGDLSDAAARYRESLALRQGVGEPGSYAAWLAGVATLAAEGRHAESAARLFGATRALSNRTGYLFHLPQRDTFERAEAQAREVLGAAGFAAASDAGRALPLEEALAAALAVTGELTAGATANQSEAGRTERLAHKE